jgi:crotonobetainyl-CoA:carnitine CoA-transferase CaiB-like acyl-CoA transferase
MKFLGDMGAQVIKIESATWMDTVRGNLIHSRVALAYTLIATGARTVE